MAEEFDFGSARKINSLYAALLSITPFSKKELQRYDNILSDRNLLVHHGGVFTTEYVTQRLKNKITQNCVHYDSLVISKREFEDVACFLEKIAFKLINATKKSLEKFVIDNNLTYDDELKKTINFLNWWDE